MAKFQTADVSPPDPTYPVPPGPFEPPVPLPGDPVPRPADLPPIDPPLPEPGKKPADLPNPTDPPGPFEPPVPLPGYPVPRPADIPRISPLLRPVRQPSRVTGFDAPELESGQNRPRSRALHYRRRYWLGGGAGLPQAEARRCPGPVGSWSRLVSCEAAPVSVTPM